MKTVNNHIYPFFWQHGEDEATLSHYVDKIYESGMRALCVESRPHPDFVGDKWWQDMGVIIRECQKRDMKVWILDDSHFPTGFANGKIKSDFPELRKQYLTMRRYDVAGPFKGARIDASLLKGKPWVSKQSDIIDVVGVYMAERASTYNLVGDPIKADTLVDITDCFTNQDTITLDISKGNWSVFVVFSTHEGGEEATKDYLNPLIAEATQVLVDEVYEKHYAHLSEYFGRTITAFFSDEPRFGNDKGTQSWIGKPDMVLPWRPGLEKELSFDKSFLPLLWVPEARQGERDVRFAYMDLITREYNQNFTQVLADWCQAHKVEYLGHNIEDNGSHARLGYGAGHFFRGQEAQHFSGIDVIGGQVVPGMPYHHDAYQTGGSDGQFYHYALAKLGASAAQLYPHKKGRAMCEAYGAYGWNEGLKTMKWITDHLLVRGINYIVPHAFTPKAYPDFDCPPHFYAHGHNPQYRYMPQLTTYMNRLMTLFSDGQQVAPLALFYPAELEWASRDYMPVEIPARALTEAQLDFNIVSRDLLEDALVEDTQLIINQHSFEALVMPYGAYYPKPVLDILNRLTQAGLRIIYVDALPKNEAQLLGSKEVVELSDLAYHLTPVAELTLSQPFKELVYYHYQKAGKDYWMFFNESLSDTLDVTVAFAHENGRAVAFDAYSNQYQEIVENRLRLAPYENVVWIFGSEIEGENAPLPVRQTDLVSANWTVAFAKSLDYPNFTPVTQLTELVPINQLDGYNRVSGTVSYETTLTLEKASEIIGLDLRQAYEVAEVFVNGHSAGVKIAPPYQFEVIGLFKDGLNTLRIEVTNTLGTEFRGGLNQYLLVEPFGLIEEVKMLRK